MSEDDTNALVEIRSGEGQFEIKPSSTPSQTVYEQQRSSLVSSGMSSYRAIAASNTSGAAQAVRAKL